jgi:glucose 1-dehydrogenase
MENDRFNLHGRVALITGAGRGIGLGMAKVLAEQGCAVAIQDLDVAVAEAEAAKINAAGGKAIALGGDICDLSLPATLVSQVVERLGGIHILINNASIQSSKQWDTITVEEFEHEHRANLMAPLLLSQQVAPIFRQQRFGRIIHIGSIQGRQGNNHMFAYSMSKSSLLSLNHVMARDLAASQITVNVISPGWIDTWRNRGDMSQPARKAQLGHDAVPTGRIGEPADFAGITLLLCSDAGSYITGQVIYVDGGMSA